MPSEFPTATPLSPLRARRVGVAAALRAADPRTPPVRAQRPRAASRLPGAGGRKVSKLGLGLRSYEDNGVWPKSLKKYGHHVVKLFADLQGIIAEHASESTVPELVSRAWNTGVLGDLARSTGRFPAVAAADLRA